MKQPVISASDLKDALGTLQGNVRIMDNKGKAITRVTIDPESRNLILLNDGRFETLLNDEITFRIEYFMENKEIGPLSDVRIGIENQPTQFSYPATGLGYDFQRGGIALTTDR